MTEREAADPTAPHTTTEECESILLQYRHSDFHLDRERVCRLIADVKVFTAKERALVAALRSHGKETPYTEASAQLGGQWHLLTCPRLEDLATRSDLLRSCISACTEQRALLAGQPPDRSGQAPTQDEEGERLAEVAATQYDAGFLYCQETEVARRDEEVARLREALRRYGAHDGTCAAVVPIDGMSCTCGYAALSGEAEG